MPTHLFHESSPNTMVIDIFSYKTPYRELSRLLPNNYYNMKTLLVVVTRSLVQTISSQHISYHLVHSLSLPISLRVISHVKCQSSTH